MCMCVCERERVGVRMVGCACVCVHEVEKRESEKQLPRFSGQKNVTWREMFFGFKDRDCFALTQK